MLDFTDLIADHKAQLGKAVERFRADDDADFARHLRLAGGWLDGRWPRLLNTRLLLLAGVNEYPAPTDCAAVLSHSWGQNHRHQPWNESDPGYPPLLTLIQGETGPLLLIAPAPTAAQIMAWGDGMHYCYRLAHIVSASEVTPTEAHRGDLLLAALIEAMRDLAAETTVVQLHKGLSGLPTAGTPAYLYETLIREWERR